MAYALASASDEHLTTGGTPSDTPYTGAITLFCHANIANGSQFHYFLGKHASSGSVDNPFSFRTDDAGTPKMVLERANASGVRIWNGALTTVGSYKAYGVSAGANVEDAPDFYVNGSATSGTAGGGSETGSPTGTSAPIRLGSRPDGVVKMNGDVAEYAIWNVELTAGEHASLGVGVSPLLVRPGALVNYWTLLSGVLVDIVGGLTLTEVNTPTKAIHPPIFNPAAPLIAPFTAAAATQAGFTSGLAPPLGMLGAFTFVPPPPSSGIRTWRITDERSTNLLEQHWHRRTDERAFLLTDEG